MRIYGGSDFYDCVLGYGIDPSVVLLRKNEKIDPKEAPISCPLRLNVSHGWTLKHITVVFASKVYHGVGIDGIGINDHGIGIKYFWSADKLHAWIAEHKGCEVTARDLQQRGTEVKLEDYFAVKDSPQKLTDYMISLGYAILLKIETTYGEPEVTVNPHGLKHLGFAKALDPYTAYQELSMWVGGVLAGESPKIVRITSDRVLLEGHGFDNVISFRGPIMK